MNKDNECEFYASRRLVNSFGSAFFGCGIDASCANCKLANETIVDIHEDVIKNKSDLSDVCSEAFGQDWMLKNYKNNMKEWRKIRKIGIKWTKIPKCL